MVEKHNLLCHGKIWCYILDDFLEVFILDMPYERSNFFWNVVPTLHSG